MSELKKILMERDGLTEEEANRQIEETSDYMYDCIEDGNFENAYYALEELGLEPDYLMDLI